MKQTEKRPFRPTVTMGQMLAFDPQDARTFTDTPLVNAVLGAFFELRPITKETVGAYLDIAPTKLSAALDVLTGFSFAEIRAAWMQHQLHRLQELHPELGADEIARRIGYHDNSSVWRMQHRNIRKAVYADNKRLGLTGHHG